jgi:hypothetical protein
MLSTQLLSNSSNHETASITEDQGGKRRKRSHIDRGRNVSHAKNSIKRISRACDVCRLKKNRCDGARPTCHQCATGGHKCTYGAQVRKRGLPTGYVRVLEALWALTLKLVPNSEETALALLKSVYVRYDEEEKAIFESDHLAPDEPLRKIWAHSQLRQRIDQVVGQFENGTESGLHGQHQDRLLKSSMSSLDDRTAMPFEQWSMDASSTSKPSQHPLNEYAVSRDLANEFMLHQQEEPRKSTSWRQAVPQFTTHKGPSASIDETSFRKPTSTLQYHIPENVWTLIDTYFTFTNCWFPIIHKHKIMKIASSQEDGSGGDPTEIALLFAVMALVSTRGLASDDVDQTDVQSRYQVASQMISNKESACSLDLIQVLLVLAMTDMARGKWEIASVLVGRATRTMLLWQNIIPERTGTATESGNSALAKRTTLGIFILDTMIAAHLRSLPHLRSRDIQGFLDFDEDGPEEWDQWVNKHHHGSIAWPPQAPSHQQTPIRALSTFKEYARLLSVLNDAICSSFRVVVGQSDQEKYMTALESWVLNVSRHNKLTTLQPPPPTANLHLTYATVLVYLRLLTDSSSLHHSPPLMYGSNVSSICAAALPAYKETFGHYQWQGILQLHIKLRSHTSTMDILGTDCYSTDQSDCLVPIITHHPASSILQTCSDAQIINPQLRLGEMDILATDSNFEQEAESASRAPFAMDDEFCHRQGEIMQIEAVSSAIDPHNLLEEPGRDDMPHCHDNTDNMSVDMTISMSPFNHFQDAGTIESLLEELSSTNENDWAMMPSQFMYNLGFYDSEPND